MLHVFFREFRLVLSPTAQFARLYSPTHAFDGAVRWILAMKGGECFAANPFIPGRAFTKILAISGPVRCRRQGQRRALRFQ